MDINYCIVVGQVERSRDLTKSSNGQKYSNENKVKINSSFYRSKEFYNQLGFEEFIIDSKMSYFNVNENLGFYLQNSYVKDWIDNSMLFLEVDNLDVFEKELLEKELPNTYKNVRVSKIRNESWGRELFVHDPSGILWHFGEFIEQ